MPQPIATQRLTLLPRGFVLFCVLLGGMGQGIVSPQLPLFLKGSQSLPLDAGLSATLMYLGVFCATFIFGQIADKGQIHWVLSGGLLGYGLTLFGFSTLPQRELFFCLRFLEGVSLSAVFVSADFVLARQSSDSQRGRWLSYYGVALSIGLLLGPLWILLCKRSPDLPTLTPLLSLATLVAAATLGAVNVRIPIGQKSAISPAMPSSAPLLAAMAYGALEASLVAVLPVLAVQEFGANPETLLMTIILSAATFSIVWGEVSDRAGARRIVFTLGSLLALVPWIGILMMKPGTPNLGIAYGMGIFFGAIAGGLYPVALSWLLQGFSPLHFGFASGAFTRAYGLGSLVGPLLAGFLVEHFGFSGLLILASFLGTLTALRTYWNSNRLCSR